jgi:hypothetical protein
MAPSARAMLAANKHSDEGNPSPPFLTTKFLIAAAENSGTQSIYAFSESDMVPIGNLPASLPRCACLLPQWPSAQSLSFRELYGA